MKKASGDKRDSFEISYLGLIKVNPRSELIKYTLTKINPKSSLKIVRIMFIIRMSDTIFLSANYIFIRNIKNLIQIRPDKI